jgi:hypothetical protein
VITQAPGVYVMGLQFLRRRKSALIDGAGADANDLADHLVAYLKEGDAGKADDVSSHRGDVAVR